MQNVPDAKARWEIQNYVLLVQEKDTLLSLDLSLNSVDSLLIVILLLRMFSFYQWSVFDENILNKDLCRVIFVKWLNTVKNVFFKIK